MYSSSVGVRIWNSDWPGGGEGVEMGGLNGAGATEYLRDENRGRQLLGSGDAQASQKRAKGRPAEENNPHKTSRDGAAQ